MVLTYSVISLDSWLSTPDFRFPTFRPPAGCLFDHVNSGIQLKLKLAGDLSPTLPSDSVSYTTVPVTVTVTAVTVTAVTVSAVTGMEI